MFEGKPETMYASLEKLQDKAAFPDNMLLFPGYCWLERLLEIDFDPKRSHSRHYYSADSPKKKKTASHRSAAFGRDVFFHFDGYCLAFGGGG